MRKLLASFLLITTLLVCTAPLASACGDKVLVLGRGVKFGNIASSYHASIIAFVPDSVPQSAAVNDPRFQAALQKAGVPAAARSTARRSRPSRAIGEDTTLSWLICTTRR